MGTCAENVKSILSSVEFSSVVKSMHIDVSGEQNPSSRSLTHANAEVHVQGDELPGQMSPRTTEQSTPQAHRLPCVNVLCVDSHHASASTSRTTQSRACFTPTTSSGGEIRIMSRKSDTREHVASLLAHELTHAYDVRAVHCPTTLSTLISSCTLPFLTSAIH